MKNFRHIFVGFLLLIGLTVGVSAQRGNDPKKPPPKNNPPKVEPVEKPARPPRGDDKPKKPGSGFALIWRSDDKYIA